MSKHAKKKRKQASAHKAPISAVPVQELESVEPAEVFEESLAVGPAQEAITAPVDDLRFSENYSESVDEPFDENFEENFADSEDSASEFDISSYFTIDSDDEPGEMSEQSVSAFPSYDAPEDTSPRKPAIQVPSAPQFLSFVEDVREDESRKSGDSGKSLSDLIAELSSSLVLSEDAPVTSSPAESWTAAPDPSPAAVDEVFSSRSGSHVREAEAPLPEAYRVKRTTFTEESSSPADDFDFYRDFDALRDELRGFSGAEYSGDPLSNLFDGLDSLGEEEELRIDKRFNISGESASTIRFGGKEIDLTADPDYVQQAQPDYFAVPTEERTASVHSHESATENTHSSFLGSFLGRRNRAKAAEVRASLAGRSEASGSEYHTDISNSVGFDSSSDPVPDDSFELSSFDFADQIDSAGYTSSTGSPWDDIGGEDPTYTTSPAEDFLDSAENFFDNTEDLESILASVRVPGTRIDSTSPVYPEEEDSDAESNDESYADTPPASATPHPHAVTGSLPVDYFEDTPSEGYLNDTDYDYSDPDGDDFESTIEGVDYFPSTFKEYLASGFTAFLFKLRPAERGGSATMPDSREPLGDELSPAAASRYYGSFSTSLRGRLRLSVILLLIMAYVSVGWPTTGMLRSVTGAAEFCLLFQLSIMVLCLDTVTSGIMDLARRKPGAASLSVIACIFTSLDVLLSAIMKHGTLHMPLCVFSSLSLVGLQFAAMLHAKGMRKALRVPAISKRCYSVTGEMNVKPREITLLKSLRPVTGFVRRSEEAAPDEEFFQKAAPFILLLSLLLGIIAAAANSLADLVYYIAAILSAAVPFTALLSFSLPFYLGSVSIFKSGAAIAGWSGLSDIGRSRNLIITDRDIFPDGSVDFESIRIFADEDSEKVITYAGTIIAASGSCLAGPFADLMLRNNCRMRNVSNFEFLSGGGFKGLIDGDVVICGNSDVLRLMNIRVPYKLTGSSTVLLAINGVLYGIFKMKYTKQNSVMNALLALMRTDRHPIFAIRDFNVTPEMLHEVFDIATDGYDFPPYIERFQISSAEPSENSQISAVVCREGLGSLTHLADTGHSMFRAVQANTVISALASVIGLLAMFILLLFNPFAPIGGFVLFMVISALPVFFISVFMKD